MAPGDSASPAARRWVSALTSDTPSATFASWPGPDKSECGAQGGKGVISAARIWRAHYLASAT